MSRKKKLQLASVGLLSLVTLYGSFQVMQRNGEKHSQTSQQSVLAFQKKNRLKTTTTTEKSVALSSTTVETTVATTTVSESNENIEPVDGWSTPVSEEQSVTEYVPEESSENEWGYADDSSTTNNAQYSGPTATIRGVTVPVVYTSQSKGFDASDVAYRYTPLEDYYAFEQQAYIGTLIRELQVGETVVLEGRTLTIRSVEVMNHEDGLPYYSNMKHSNPNVTFLQTCESPSSWAVIRMITAS